MKIFIAILFILHGLITAAFSTGSFKPGDSVQNPAWLNWCPVNMGQSWLLSSIGIDRSPVTALGGILYLIGGVALIGAGLSLLGWIVPPAWTPALALVGGGIGLLMLVIYLHPFYVIGIAANVAVLAAILWLRWPTFMILPE